MKLNKSTIQYIHTFTRLFFRF